MLKKLIKSDFRSLAGIVFRGVLFCHLIIFLFTETALCQKKDTTYIYYKLSSINNSFYKVSTIDSADFIRILCPANQAKNIIPVTQFYSNGKVNFTGSYDLSIYNGSKIAVLKGDYISFYPDGKKQSFLHYTNGFKDGVGYFFYPNGKIYCSRKYAKDLPPDGSYWDCFDNNGSQICEEGNGQWITYDGTFKPILQGPVKNGLPDGEWHGKTFEADSIKYTYVYKKGKFISGKGYDKFENQYSFKNFVDESSVKSNPFKFIEKLRANFKIPNNANIKKASLDTALVSFTLEKDGRFTNSEIIGNNDPALRQALQNALNKCTEEKPKRYYGVPLRSKITISFKDISKTTLSSYNYTIPSTTATRGAGALYVPNEPKYIDASYTTTTKTLSLKEEILGFD